MKPDRWQVELTGAGLEALGEPAGGQRPAPAVGEDWVIGVDGTEALPLGAVVVAEPLGDGRVAPQDAPVAAEVLPRLSTGWPRTAVVVRRTSTAP